MLLGLVIHGCLSFLPEMAGAWPVSDSQPNPNFWWVMSFIHGFRMPLFFLISGFFTAMLWKKRGMRSLLAHRFKRIFLPLLIGLFTIIPSIWIASAYVSTPLPSTFDENVAAADVDPGTVWMAAAKGDVESIERWTDTGVDMDRPTPDGSTPLAGAILFGRADVVRSLLDAGADLNRTNQRGESAVSMLAADVDITRAIATLVQVEFADGELFAGRQQIAELASTQLNDDEPMELLAVGRGEAQAQSSGMAEFIALLAGVPILAHLWFLWFLCLLVLGFFLVVVAAQAIGLRSLPPALTLPHISLLWAVPLTAMMQHFMPDHGSPFGPETSEEIIPALTVVGYYAVFFAWGAMHFAAPDQNPPVGRHWKVGLPLSVVLLLPLGLILGERADVASQVVFTLCQVCYAWLVSWGVMGLFRSVASGESRLLRYVSDSSYWVYLVHLPLIIYIQYLFRDLAVSSWLKLPAIVVVCGLVSLASYQLFVRYTPIGTLLNGKRHRLRGTSMT